MFCYWVIGVFVCFNLFLPLCSLQSKESKKQLHKLVDEVTEPVDNFEKFIKTELDHNNDGLVSKKEMISKIERSFKQRGKNEIDKLMKECDLNQDKKISWHEFLSTSYPTDMSKYSKDDVDYDKQKFNMADVDKDGFLDSKEFASFYFPTNDNENLLEWLTSDWLNKVDLNHDGFVTLSEFMASQSVGNPDFETQKKLREHFTEEYDINKDLKLDRHELREWLVPNRASARKETEKILKSADNNGDGSLSIYELLQNNKTVVPILKKSNFMYQEKDEL